MKSFKSQEINWYVQYENLVPVLQHLSLPEGGRRGYVIADYGEGRIFVKSFVERGVPGFIRNTVAARGKREYVVGTKLLSLGIPTPKPLGYGVSRMNSYIVEEWIEGESLVEKLRESNYAPDLLMMLAELLGKLKTNCVRHNDLHLDNILVSGSGIYLIDLHKVSLKKSFTVADEIRNLSQALAAIYDDLDVSEREAFFEAYGNLSIRETVERAIDRLANRWIRKKKQRAFEETSLIVQRGNRYFMAGMEEKASGAFRSLIKSDRKVRVERYEDHIRKTYLNRGRLERAWKNHTVLAYMKLCIVPEAFFVELPKNNPAGFVAMEDMYGKGQEFDRFLDSKYDSMDTHERRILITSLARFFLMLTRKKIVHRDLKACNIVALDNGGFVLLDVEDIRFRPLDEEGLKRMLVQLNTTIPKRISQRDRIRFFLHLTAPMKLSKRIIFKAVVKESKRREIVYEGIKGLKREEW